MSNTNRSPFLVITCEHGGNKIPPEFLHLFRGKEKILQSHQGWDPGALGFARKIASRLGAPLFYEEISRLVVEQNRSRTNSRIFSEFMSGLSSVDKEQLLEKVYDPYHDRVLRCINDAIIKGDRVCHYSIHSFTSVLNGNIRNADVGFLYDPSRRGEKEACLFLQALLLKQIPGIRVKRNYPYLGISDGMTKKLRLNFTEEKYTGIEIEVNQKHYLGESSLRERIEESIIEGIETTMNN